MTAELLPTTVHEQVVAFLDRGLGSDHDAYELAGCFEAIENAGSLAHRLDSLIALIEWTRQGPTDADGRPDRSRLVKAVDVLEALPDVRRARAGGSAGDLGTADNGVRGWLQIAGDTGSGTGAVIEVARAQSSIIRCAIAFSCSRVDQRWFDRCLARRRGRFRAGPFMAGTLSRLPR